MTAPNISRTNWRSRRVLRVGLGLAAFLVLLVLTRILLRPNYYSPAATPRPHIHEYIRAMDSNMVTRTSLELSVPVFTVTTNAQYITLQRTKRTFPADRPKSSAAFHMADAGARVRTPGLSVQLKRIGMAHRTNAIPTSASATNRLPASFFTPALAPYDNRMLLAELPKVSDRQLSVVWYFPEVCFDFELQGASARIVDLRLFDARTGQSLGLPDSTRLSSGEIRISARARIWHASPVLLVMDISTETFKETVPLRPGTSFHVGDISGQIIFVGDSVKPEVQQYGSRGADSVFTLRPAASNSFVCLHTASRSDWRTHDLVFRPAAGRPFSVTPANWFDDLQMLNIPQSVGPGDRLEISQPARRHRLVFQLPKLPGLPAANQNVGNLFAVTVPYARFENPRDHLAFVLDVTQLGRDEYHPLEPSGLTGYPREYTNATPAEMLHDYSELILAAGAFEVDDQALQVQWNLPDLRKKLRELWDKLTKP